MITGGIKILKCVECSYSTNYKNKRFCPYDGAELVESDQSHLSTIMDEYDDKYNENN